VQRVLARLHGDIERTRDLIDVVPDRAQLTEQDAQFFKLSRVPLRLAGQMDDCERSNPIDRVARMWVA
jgi:hypothetical protein